MSKAFEPLPTHISFDEIYTDLGLNHEDDSLPLGYLLENHGSLLCRKRFFGMYIGGPELYATMDAGEPGPEHMNGGDVKWVSVLGRAALICAPTDVGQTFLHDFPADEKVYRRINNFSPNCHQIEFYDPYAEDIIWIFTDPLD